METLIAGLAEKGAEKAAETGAELLINGIPAALSALAKHIRERKQGAEQPFQDAFIRYLRNAAGRYNQVKTMVTGPDPRAILGPESIYVKIGVARRKHTQSAFPWRNPFFPPVLMDRDEFDEISTVSANSLLGAARGPGRNRHILVLGTGGAGKSMLIRYLFLTTARDGDYVPVLLELRRIGNLAADKRSVPDLIYAAMEDFDVTLPREQFEETLRLGKYLFLLDGLDEVKEQQFADTVRAVQTFCAKYPENPCVMTSRPRPDFAPPETFTVVESMPLDADQAAKLAGKLWPEDEKTVEFCRQLKNGLYEAHRSFAENPLLLSILFLTFMRNSSIPDHLAEFYDKAYEALYSVHDRNNKDYYQRDFKSGLDEADFKLLFARFCFQTYFAQQYEFSREEILSELGKSVKKLGLKAKPQDFLFDLQRAVCLIVEEGLYYKFSHRTFQSYFAAWYTRRLTDDEQKRLFQRLLYDRDPTPDNVDYLEMLCQLDLKRFSVNALEKGLRELLQAAEASDNPDLYLLKAETEASFYDTLDFDDFREANGAFSRDRLFLSIFRLYIAKLDYQRGLGDWLDDKTSFSPTPRNLYSFARMCLPFLKGASYYAKLEGKSLIDALKGDVSFDDTYDEIETSENLTDADRRKMYKALCDVLRIPELRKALRKWLDELDRERAGTDSRRFFEDF